MGNTQSSPDKAKAGKTRRSFGAKLPYTWSPSKHRVKRILDPGVRADASNQNNRPSSTPAPDDAPSPTNVPPQGKLKEGVDGQTRPVSPDSVIEDVQLKSQLDLLALDVARTLSRPVSEASMVKSARSSTAQLPNASQTSLVSGRTVDVQTAVALIAELRKTASPEDLAALHRALAGSSKDSLPLQPSDYRPDATAAALIRTKSLAKPGIATRLPKSETESRRSSKPSSPTKNQHQLTSRDKETPSFLYLETERLLDPPQRSDEDRANTPTNLERSQLGSLKHGSLVVMNGSDAPDLHAAPQFQSSSRRCDERGATSSTISSAASPALTRPEKSLCNDQVGREDSGVDVRSARSKRAARKSTVVADVRKTRSGSPLKREIRVGTEINCAATAENDQPSNMRASRSLVSLRASTKSRFSFEDGHSTDGGSTSSKSKQHKKKATTDPSASAVSLADEYIAELAPSPFDKEEFSPHETMIRHPDVNVEAVARAGSPALQHQAVNVHVPLQIASSHLQHQDPDHPHLDLTKPPPIARPSTSHSSDGQISPRRPLQSHPAAVPPATSGESSVLAQPPTLATASVPSVATRSVADNALPDGPPSQHDNRLSLASELHSVDQAMPATLTKVDRRSVVVYSSCAPDTVAIADQKAVASVEEDAEKENKDDVGRKKSWRRSLRKSLPRILSSSETSPANKRASVLSLVSELPTNGDKKLGKKLQKRRRSSKPGSTRPSLEIDQSDPHVWESGVPNVPTSVFARYSQRMHSSSAVEQLEGKHQDRHASRSVSAGPSLDRRPKSPTPDAHFTGEDNDVAPAPPRHRIGIGRNAFRKSKTDFTEPEISVADLGETAKSLGSSPYDVAMATTRNPPSTTVGTLAQPHQITDLESRPAPREGWDAATASRIMHERSKERAQRIMRAPSPALADIFVYESSRERAQRMDPGLDVRCPPLATQRPKSAVEGMQVPQVPDQRPGQQITPLDRDQISPHQPAQWSSPPFARPRSAFEPGLAPRMHMPQDYRPMHGVEIAGYESDQISRPRTSVQDRQIDPPAHEREVPRSILKHANRLSWQEGQYMRYPVDPIRRPRTTGPGATSHRQVSHSMHQYNRYSWHPTEYVGYQPEPIQRPKTTTIDDRELVPLANRQQMPPRVHPPYNPYSIPAARGPVYPPQPSQHPPTTGPVKQLVTAYEQRVALETSPPRKPVQSGIPRPERSPGPDWSDSSRQWRERRLIAQTQNFASTEDPAQNEALTPKRQVLRKEDPTSTTAITMSPYGPRMTTTTVSNLALDQHRQQHQHQQQQQQYQQEQHQQYQYQQEQQQPQQQTQASSTQIETPSPPMLHANNSMPEIHSVKLRKSMPQIVTQRASNQSQATGPQRQPQHRRPSDRSQLPSQKQRSPRSAQHDHSAISTEDGIFGRYGGAARNCGVDGLGPTDQGQISPSGRAGRGFHGMDCGDVSYRVI